MIFNKISVINKALFIYLFCLLFINCLQSQEVAQDDLLDIKELKSQLYLATTDTIQARLASQISTVYRNIIEIDSCKKYASLANGFLDHKNIQNKDAIQSYKKISATAIENYGAVLSYQNAKTAVDTLKYSLKLWKDIDDKNGIAKAYFTLGKAYSFSSNQIEAISYLNKSLSLYKELNNKEKEAETLYELSLEKRYLGNYGDALEFSLKSLKVAEEIKDTVHITNALLGNSFNYLLSKKYAEALKEQEKALRLFQLSKDSIGIATTYNDMGVTNMRANNLQESLDYHKKALEIRKRVDLRGVSASYNYIATIYNELGQLDEAAKNIQEGIIYSIKYADSRFVMNNYEEAGNIYAELGKYEQAISNYTKGLEVAKNNDNKGYQAIFFARLGQIQRRIGNFNIALTLLKQAEENVPANDYQTRKFVYEILVITYQEKNDFKNAFNYQSKFYMIKDSLDAIKKDEKITALTQELIYENQSALQKASQEKQIALKETQLQKQKLIRNLSIAGLVLILVFAVIFFKRFKEKRELSLNLENTLSHLKETQSQLIQSEKMASLGELTAGIAHEIQNPLNFVNNFSEVSNELMDEMNEELDKGDIQEAKAISADIKLNLEKIKHHGKRADAIVKGMLAHSRSSSGEKIATDINELADEYLRLSYHGLRAKDKSFNANFKTHFDPDLPKLSIVPQDIGRVVLNLINNAFQACNEKQKTASADYYPEVVVVTKAILSQSGEFKGACISVSDNGSGIPEEIKSKIFQPFFTTKPTGEGTGLGLSLSYDILKTHGGELKVESTVGQGTAFSILIYNDN